MQQNQTTHVTPKEKSEHIYDRDNCEDGQAVHPDKPKKAQEDFFICHILGTESCFISGESEPTKCQLLWLLVIREKHTRVHKFCRRAHYNEKDPKNDIALILFELLHSTTENIPFEAKMECGRFLSVRLPIPVEGTFSGKMERSDVCKVMK